MELRGAAGPLDALREPLGHHRVLVEGAVEEDERAVVLRVADEAARGLVDVAVRLGLVPRLAVAAGVLDFEPRRRVEARRVRHADDHDAARGVVLEVGALGRAAAHDGEEHGAGRRGRGGAVGADERVELVARLAPDLDEDVAALLGVEPRAAARRLPARRRELEELVRLEEHEDAAGRGRRDAQQRGRDGVVVAPRRRRLGVLGRVRVRAVEFRARRARELQRHERRRSARRRRERRQVARGDGVRRVRLGEKLRLRRAGVGRRVLVLDRRRRRRRERGRRQVRPVPGAELEAELAREQVERPQRARQQQERPARPPPLGLAEARGALAARQRLHGHGALEAEERDGAAPLPVAAEDAAPALRVGHRVARVARGPRRALGEDVAPRRRRGDQLVARGRRGVEQVPELDEDRLEVVDRVGPDGAALQALVDEVLAHLPEHLAVLVDALRVLEAQDVSHERRRVRAAPDALLFVLERVALPRRRGAERRRGAGRRRRAAEPRQQGAERAAARRHAEPQLRLLLPLRRRRRVEPRLDGLEGARRRRDEALEHALRLGVFAEVRRELLERLDHVREAVLRDLVGRGVARDRRQVVTLVDDDHRVLQHRVEAAGAADHGVDELRVRDEDERGALLDLVLGHVERADVRRLALLDGVLDVPDDHRPAEAKVRPPLLPLRVADALGLVEVRAALALLRRGLAYLRRLLAGLGLVRRRRDVRVQAEPLAREPQRHERPVRARPLVLVDGVLQLVVRPRDPDDARRRVVRVLPLPGQHRRERREGLARPRRRLEQRRPRGPHRSNRAVHDLELRPVRRPGARQVHRHALARQRQHAARRLRVEVDDRRRQRLEAAAHVRVPLLALAPPAGLGRRRRRRLGLLLRRRAARGPGLAFGAHGREGARRRLRRARQVDHVVLVREVHRERAVNVLLVLCSFFESAARTTGARATGLEYRQTWLVVRRTRWRQGPRRMSAPAMASQLGKARVLKH